MRFFGGRATDFGGTRDDGSLPRKEAGEVADAVTPTGIPPSGSQQDEKQVGSHLQGGVAKAEATTIVWTKRDLITAYILYVSACSSMTIPTSP